MKTFFIKNIYKIKIVAFSKKELFKLSKAIKILKSYNKKIYKKLGSMEAILIYPKKSYDNELFTKERIWISYSQTIKEADEIYLASLILHEVMHLIQSDNKKKNTGAKAETEAYQAQRKFLVKMNQKNSVEWLDEQYKQKWWIYKDKKGRKSLYFPSYKTFRRFLNLYQTEKLKLKKLK